MSQSAQELAREQRLEEIIASYLDDCVLGRAPQRHLLLDQHPDLAADLEEFFSDCDQFDRIASPLRRVVACSPAEGAQTSAIAAHSDPTSLGGPCDPQATIAANEEPRTAWLEAPSGTVPVGGHPAIEVIRSSRRLAAAAWGWFSRHGKSASSAWSR
jgi:hypothetical protein